MTPPLKHSHNVQSLAFSPDSKKLLSGTNNAAILWDVASAKQIGEPLPHGGFVTFAQGAALNYEEVVAYTLSRLRAASLPV